MSDELLPGLSAIGEICRRLCDFSMSGYECSKFSQCYHIGSHLTNHVQIAHGDPDFNSVCKLGECSPSGRYFIAFESFRKHMKRKHVEGGSGEPENGSSVGVMHATALWFSPSPHLHSLYTIFVYTIGIKG